MRLNFLVMAVAALAVVSTPAMATYVDDGSNPDSELDLYEIYNALYGTSFSSTAEMSYLQLSTSEDELFALSELTDPPSTAVDFIARYAGYQQRFGYYTYDDENNVVYTQLFDIIAGGLITDGTGASGVVTEEPFGFYDDAPIDGDNVWHSEQSLNNDGEDHMVAYWAPLSCGGELQYDDEDHLILSDECFIIAFEDRWELGDTDYNDLVVEVCPGIIPEPSTAGLLLLGLGAVFAHRRFRA
jgi:hypothetical protein